MVETPSIGQVAEPTIEELVAQLADDSYAARLTARRRLLEIAETGITAAEQVDRALKQPTSISGELEYDLARSEVRQRIASRREDRLHHAFLHQPNTDGPWPNGWTTFRRFAGDDFDARQVFLSILRRHRSFGEQLQTTSTDHRHHPPFAAESVFYRLDRLDWVALLAMECHQRPSNVDRRGQAIVSLLSREGLGPDMQAGETHLVDSTADIQRRVFARMLRAYLDTTYIDLHDRICIGMRYECEQMVETSCRSVLSDRSQSPANISVALLAMAVRQSGDDQLSRWLEDFQDDRRIAAVWRTAAPTKRTVRTELRDVVLAIRIDRQGFDPRDFGFASLRAHPRLRYQPYSLGFDSDPQRRAAHQAFRQERQQVNSSD